MNRRQFLSVNIASLIFGLTSAALPAKTTNISAEQVGLLVVGAGFAGLTAAVVAAENGVKDVVVIEKEPLIGGSSILSRGSWAVSGTALQKSQGIVDSDEEFYREIMNAGGQVNNRDLVKRIIPENRKQFEWFLSRGLKPATVFAEGSVPRVHAMDPEAMILELRRAAVQLGIKIRTGVKAVELIVDKGRVIGLKAMQSGKPINFYVKRDVILCTGGFGRNKKLLEQVQPLMRNVLVLSAQGSTGDGITMARKLGANLVDTEHLKASYAFTEDARGIDDKTLANYLGAVIVDDNAKRFVNESNQYRYIADAVLAQPLGRSYLVFDQPIFEQLLKIESDKPFWKEVAKDKKLSYVFTGKTIEEAAKNALLDPEILKKTIDNYNQNILEGKGDPAFKRTPIVSSNQKLQPINKPPFYIVSVKACILGTYCGLEVNDKAQVLNKKGKPIPGLLAAGEVAGGVHGMSAIMGGPILSAFGLGRIAGITASENNDENS